MIAVFTLVHSKLFSQANTLAILHMKTQKYMSKLFQTFHQLFCKHFENLKISFTHKTESPGKMKIIFFPQKHDTPMWDTIKTSELIESRCLKLMYSKVIIKSTIKKDMKLKTVW